MAGHHHGHHHSGHGHGPIDFGRAFAIGIALNIGFVLIEATAGVLTDSMALLADAGHNFSDVVSLALAWVGAGLAKRPPSRRFTWGYHGASILASIIGVFQVRATDKDRTAMAPINRGFLTAGLLTVVGTLAVALLYVGNENGNEGWKVFGAVVAVLLFQNQNRSRRLFGRDGFARGYP